MIFAFNPPRGKIRISTAGLSGKELISEYESRIFSLTWALGKKRAQLREYARIASHNLRAPLANIIGLLSIHECAKGHEDFVFENLKLATEDLSVAIQKLHQLLEIESSIDQKAVEINLGQLLYDIIDDKNQLIGIELLKFELNAGERFIVKFNRQSLIEALHILLGFLIYRCMNGNKEILLKTELTKSAGLTIIAFTYPEVIEKNELSELFSFRQHFNVCQGAGVFNLYMARMTLMSSGGDMIAVSDSNIGTVFKIVIDNEKI